MYRKIDPPQRMTRNEAMERYPLEYILMQLDKSNSFDGVGYVLYVGDDDNELFSMQINLPVPLGIVIEGLYVGGKYQLGGLVRGDV